MFRRLSMLAASLVVAAAATASFLPVFTARSEACVSCGFRKGMATCVSTRGEDGWQQCKIYGSDGCGLFGTCVWSDPHEGDPYYY